MNILRKGQKPSDTYIGQCDKCDSIVEAHTSELRNTDPIAYGRCPFCCYIDMLFHQDGSLGAAILRSKVQ